MKRLSGIGLMVLLALAPCLAQSGSAGGAVTITFRVPDNCVTGDHGRVDCPQGAILELLTQDGEAIPLGAQVQVVGTADSYTVDTPGQLVVPHMSFPAQLKIQWADKQWTATAKTGPRREVLPRIGLVFCAPAFPEPGTRASTGIGTGTRTGT